jgi:hypothetical protein
MKCLPFAPATEAEPRSAFEEEPRVIAFVTLDVYRARQAARRRHAEQKRFWSRWQANPRITFADEE